MQKLPIDQILPEVKNTLNREVKPLIVTASPGSGKTTRLPAFLLNELNIPADKKIVVIVPKRVSAIGAADRVAIENNWILGQKVGYQVRFEQKVSTATQLIYMTEGLLLKKAQDEKFWQSLHTLILDEIHERSCALDLILGLAFERNTLFENFNLIVMSATINVKELQNFFKKSNVIELEHKPFPLEIVYSEKSQKLMTDDIFYQNLKDTCLQAWKKTTQDILIFLPGQKEIINAQKILAPIFPQTKIQSLHGALDLQEQKNVIKNTEAQSNQMWQRRIVLSTNVAESSVTVSGVDCVIDCGLEKTNYTESKLGFTGLELQRISQFSAKQRAGRAAREKNGVCFRMWHKIDEHSMKEQIEPEILKKTQLIDEIILLKNWGYNDPQQFSWLSKPSSAAFTQGLQLLQKMNLTEKELSLIAQIPLPTRLAFLYLKLAQKGFLEEACRLVSFLDSAQAEEYLSSLKHSSLSDLDKILDFFEVQNPARHSAIFKVYEQLKKYLPDLTSKEISTKTLRPERVDSFKKELLQIYAQYFPTHVAHFKTLTSAVSLQGRGLQLPYSVLAKDEEYFIILSGKETRGQFTQCIACLGFNKKTAQQLFKDFSEKVISIEFDPHQKKFYKFEKVVFQSVILNDLGKTPLAFSEIDLHWVDFFKQNTELFFSLHSDYSDFKNKFYFIIQNNQKYFKLPTEDLITYEELLSLAAKQISLYSQTYEDFLSLNIWYFFSQLLSDSIVELLNDLPTQIKTPKGKQCLINYTDEKAPLISLKLQDAFGWIDTPTITKFKIKLTLELLAPNMRPTQITNQLGQFWSTSYHDVRKELKARYPKHDWPENPQLIIK